MKITAIAAATMVFAAQSLMAQHCHREEPRSEVGFTITSDGYVGFSFSYGYPVRIVYSQPQVVYYPPQPVVYYPQPQMVYYPQPRVIYRSAPRPVRRGYPGFHRNPPPPPRHAPPPHRRDGDSRGHQAPQNYVSRSPFGNKPMK